MATTRQNTSVLNSFKGSYADIIMPGLAINDLKIPASAPHASVIDATLASAKMAMPRQNLEAIEMNELNQLSKDIVGKISQLEKIKTANKTFAQAHEPLKEDITKTIHDHQELLNNLYKTID